MQMGSRPNGEPSEKTRELKLPSTPIGRRDDHGTETGTAALETRAELMTLADAGRSEVLAAGISLDDCYETDSAFEGGAFGAGEVAEDELEKQYRVWRLALVRKRIVSGFYEQFQVREQIADRLFGAEFGADNQD